MICEATDNRSNATRRVVLSADTARGAAASPAHSAIILRRAGISVAYTMPLTKAAAPKCQGESKPRRPRTHITAELIEVISSPATTIRFLFIASDRTPMNAPVSKSGRLRAADTIATASPDFVTCKVNSPAASISSHNVVFASAPATHNPLNPGVLKSVLVVDDFILVPCWQRLSLGLKPCFSLTDRYSLLPITLNEFRWSDSINPVRSRRKSSGRSRPAQLTLSFHPNEGSAVARFLNASGGSGCVRTDAAEVSALRLLFMLISKCRCDES